MPIFDVTVQIRDAFNGRTTRRYQVDSADQPTAQADAAAMVADLTTYIQAGIQKFGVTEVTITGVTPGATSNIDEGATFNMDLGGGKSAALKFPSPDLASVNPDRSIDLSNTAVDDLLQHWINGPFTISDGETAVGVNSGVLDK